MSDSIDIGAYEYQPPVIPPEETIYNYGYPEGNFLFYRGSDEHPWIEGYDTLMLEPPRCTGVSHYYPNYSKGDDQILYGLLDVGTIHEEYCEYDTEFTAYDGTHYPNGIQNEGWVGPAIRENRHVINLTGYTEWREVLKWRLAHSLLTGTVSVDGIMYEGTDWGTGVHPYTEIPKQEGLMNNLVEEIHTWAEDLYGQDLLLGTVDGFAVARRGVSNSEYTLTNVTGILIDGLSTDYAFNKRTEFGRNAIRTKLLNTLSSCADYQNIYPDVFAFDYMEMQPDTDFMVDTVDIRTVRASRFYAFEENWDYNWGPDDLTSWYIEEYGMTPEMYDYGIYCSYPSGLYFPGTGMGRAYTPWGKMSGYNKLVHRAQFHLHNRPRNEDITAADTQSIPDAMVILPTNSVYRGKDNRPVNGYTLTSDAAIPWTISDLEFYGLDPTVNTDDYGRLYMQFEYATGGGYTDDYYRLSVYSDSEYTNMVAQGNTLVPDCTLTLPLVAHPVNDSELELRLRVSRNNGDATMNTVCRLNDDWLDDRGESDDVHMAIRMGRDAMLPVVVYDQFTNPVSCEYIYGTGLTGIVDPFLNITDEYGLATFDYDPTNYTGLTGYDIDKLSFLVRNPNIERNIYIDLVGCTGISYA